MPGIEISALPAATSANLTDVVPSDQLPGPVTRKISLQQVLDLFSNNFVEGVTGTTNQIDVDNTDPINPILSVSSTLIAPGTAQVGNLLLDTNTISSTDTNGDINFSPNGSGKTVFSSDLVVPVNSSVLFPTGDIAFQIAQTAVPPGTAYLIFRNSLASGGSIEAGGSNANVNIQLVPKGSAQVIISGNTDTAGKLLLRENSANGLDSVSLKAAENMSNTYVLTYPSAAPTISSSILISSTGGACSWTNFEENVSFNPVPQGSTTPGSPTGNFTGRYNRHGRRVWGDMRLNFTAITGMVGNLIIDGFPYPVSSGGENRASVAIGFRNNFTNDFVIIGYLMEGTTILNLWNGSVDATRLTIGDLSATTQFYVTFSYTTN